MACELPAKLGLPLSRFSRAELRRHVLSAGIVAEISGVTIWRWLREDAIRPWTHRSWIFPRDPEFAEEDAERLSSNRSGYRVAIETQIALHFFIWLERYTRYR